MKINIEKNENKNLTLIDESNIELNLKKDSSLNLFLYFFNDNKKVNISGKVLENSSLSLTIGDFSKKSKEICGEIDLKQDNAKANLIVRSISDSSNIKNIDISLIQSAKKTYGYSDSFGISKDKSLLKFCGVDEIKKGASGSFASLNYKVVIFDKEARGVANPILKIDEDDVKASHGAIVGRLNEDELFYLNSRGLTELESKQLIANGYFSQLLKAAEPAVKEKIENSIKEIF